MPDKQNALVTGANKGIGFAIAKALAAKGLQVWIGARDAGRGEAAVEKLTAEGHNVRFIQIDVSDDASVAAAAMKLASEVKALDVLINNAGIVRDSTPPSEAKIADLREVYETNVFGPIRATQAFLPLLKAANGARVVNISSGLGSLALVTDPTSVFSQANLLGYNSSKTALNAVSVAFAKELEPFGIKVNAVEPGTVATDLNGNTGNMTPDEGAESAVEMALIGADGPTAGFFGRYGRQPW
jgi:NAD(P)-dependent dehydrogenase (short-subunit alcohol dehydrogenase family)